MKKILIASTALVAAGLISTGSASASDKIKLELGGFSKWWVVGQWNQSKYQSNTTGASQDINSVDVKGDNEIFFSGETTLNNGIKVGINVELEAGGEKGTSNSATTDTIDQSYVYVSGGFGKVIAGTAANGTVLLHVMAPDAAANWGSENIAMQAIAQPGSVNLRQTTEIDTDDNAEKITYVAPTFYGLTVGATYVPHALVEDNRGVSSTSAETYGVGALYANEFGPVGVKLSAGWVTYDPATAVPNNQNEWSVGTQLTYAGFTLGGSYRGLNTDTNNTTLNGLGLGNGRVWDAGLQYASGPYAISFSTLQSVSDGSGTDHGHDKLALYQLSGKYAMGPGVDALASIAHVAYDSNEGANSDANHNKGVTVMTGLSLAF